MLGSDTKDLSATTIAAVQQIDAVCDDFERAWRAGDKPQIEEQLGRVEARFQDDLLAELIAAERELREKQGDSPRLTEYLTRFPDRVLPVRVAFQALTDGPPKQVGRYRILKRVGGGNFGTVYRAFDDELRRVVAIKIANRERLQRPSDADAYIEEARLIARLDHPGIVPVLDVGRTDDGVPYIISKFIEGESLAERRKRQPLSFREAASLIARVADSLHAMHQTGLIHRDIKPSNLLLDEQGLPHVTDFGLAEHEQQIVKSHGLVGSPAYMSPEQVRAAKLVDARSDIWALGVVFYELLTGERPIKATDSDGLLDQIVLADIARPAVMDASIPAALDYVCMKALAGDPSDRYQSADELAAALNACLEEDLTPKIERRTRQSVWLYGVVAAVVSLLVSFLAAVNVFDLGSIPSPLAGQRAKPVSNLSATEPATERPGRKGAATRMFSAEDAKRFQRESAQKLGTPQVFTNTIGLELTIIPPGDLLMGTPADTNALLLSRRTGWVGDWKACVESEAKMHRRVRLTKPFYVGTHEVTVREFAAYADATGILWNRPPDADSELLPATNVSWDMAVDFCNWLGEREGREYRLPTEAEWSFAARAGVETMWISGRDTELGEYAWYSENADGKLQPVGGKRPNQFGLFDVFGNAWEWCADDFTYGVNEGLFIDKNGLKVSIDPFVRTHDDPGKVFRGGACHTEAFFLRLSTRSHIDRAAQLKYYGFRVAMTIPTQRATSDRHAE